MAIYSNVRHDKQIDKAVECIAHIAGCQTRYNYLVHHTIFLSGELTKPDHNGGNIIL